MSLICFIILLIIAMVLFFTDPKNHSSRWGSFLVLVLAMGMMDIFIVEDLLPQISHYITHPYNIKRATEILDNLLMTVFTFLFPFAVLMYGLSKNGVFYHEIKWKTPLILIAFLPIMIIASVFPFVSSYRNTYHHFFAIAVNLLAIPYIFGGNFLLLSSFFREKNHRIKLDKLITCLIIVPASLYVFYTGYFVTFFHGHARDWLSAKWAVLYSVIIFIFSSLSHGALGVKLRFERVRIDSAVRAVSSGTAVLNHAVKNEVMNINLCAKFINASNVKDEKINKYSQTIINATEHMMALVARIQEHMQEIEIEEKPGNLVELIEESLGKVQHYLHDKDIEVKRDYKCKDTIMLCDPVHMKEILQNIFKNAIEAMGSQGVLVVQIYQHRKKIILAIKDNGPGISKMDLPHVMKPFFSTKCRRTNYGLGLTYCYNVMQKHGGSLEVVSEEGAGTTVLLNFPAKKARGV